MFVAFGAPKQEKWLAKWLPKLNVKGAMVVGGAIDFYAGRAKTPPNVVATFGLEWAYRLIREPWRVRRVFNAISVFPLQVFKYKLKLD